MIRMLTIAFMLVMFSQAAFAVIDPRQDVLGVYFDEYGNQTCKDDVIPFTTFSVWIVYTNPTPTQILGFEAGFYVYGTLTETDFVGPCDIVWISPPELDNLYVTCAQPFLTARATPLLHFEYIHLAPGMPDVTFHLEKARGSSLPGNNPYIILADGSSMEVQAGGPADICFTCALPTEKMGWGTIKSLYR